MERKSYHRSERGRDDKYRDRGHPIIVEDDEDNEVVGKEKAVFLKNTCTRDAAVEVTVKVKKRRDKSKEKKPSLIKIPENGFRKGSWGDLLSRGGSTASINSHKEDEVDKKSSKSNARKSPPSNKDGKSCISDHMSPLCQKIPINDDLYLETHTHVRKVRSSEDRNNGKPSRSSKRTALVRENENLRDEVERLRKEMEITKNRKKAVSHISRAALNYAKEQDSDPKTRSKPQAQATQTSTAYLPLSPPRKSGACQTDSVAKSPPKKPHPTKVSTPVQVPEDRDESSHLENLRLERENEALRREALELLTQVNKARSDYLECYNTMKELYQIASILKQENNNLAQNHQQQQTLQSKLLQALAENREIKEILDALMNKQKFKEDSQDDQLVQIRNVIQDVKKTIAQEMEGLKLDSGSATAVVAEKDNNMNAAFRLEDSFLNDTNASEIQQILGTQPPEVRRGMGAEDRSSSTQYLTIAGLSSVDSHYRPSPHATTKFSPRISTPNSSDLSFSLSEAEGASSANPIGFRPIQKPSLPREEPEDKDEWKKLEAELARSFSSVRNELSNQSTSSYSSDSSSSPNPIRRP